jgi:hypothetical protein
VHVLVSSLRPFAKSYPRVALLVCGFVGGGTTVAAAETEPTLSAAVTPKTQRPNRIIVTAIERKLLFNSHHQ